jgi:hypothetical protein
MATRKKRSRPDDPLEAYRRLRKPMPPPERVIPDKRRKAAEKEARREARGESGAVEEDPKGN